MKEEGMLSSFLSSHSDSPPRLLNLAISLYPACSRTTLDCTALLYFTMPDNATCALIRPLPRPLALTRLKSNLFILFLSLLIRTLFTPYISIKRGITALLDQLQGQSLGQRSWGATGFFLAG
jgi:hypothetical protein